MQSRDRRDRLIALEVRDRVARQVQCQRLVLRRRRDRDAGIAAGGCDRMARGDGHRGVVLDRHDRDRAVIRDRVDVEVRIAARVRGRVSDDHVVGAERLDRDQRRRVVAELLDDRVELVDDHGRRRHDVERVRRHERPGAAVLGVCPVLAHRAVDLALREVDAIRGVRRDGGARDRLLVQRFSDAVRHSS